MKPATPPLLRDLNERTVLETIRDRAPISRAEISRHVGISKPTVSVALESLLEAGLVRQALNASDGPTYGATFFEPVHEAALVLGLDLGARFLRGAICDLRGHVRARQDIELPGAAAHVVLDAAAELKERLLAASDLPAEAVDGAVAGVPGVVEASGRVGLAASIPGLEGLAVGAALRERLGVPVQVENDVSLAAVGERWRGVGQGVDDFAFLSVGTGLCAGLVLRGELHRGHPRGGGRGRLRARGRRRARRRSLGGGRLCPCRPARRRGPAAHDARAALRRAGDLRRRARGRRAGDGGRRRGGAPDRRPRGADRGGRRRRAGRHRRRDRGQRRPAAGADPGTARRAVPLSAAGRGLQPRRRRRAHRRAGGRPARGARHNVFVNRIRTARRA